MKEQPVIRCVIVEDMQPQREHYAELINGHPNLEIIKTYDSGVPFLDLENLNIHLIWQDDDIRGRATALTVAGSLKGLKFPKMIVLTEGMHEPTRYDILDYLDVILTYQSKRDFNREKLDKIFKEIIADRLKEVLHPTNLIAFIDIDIKVDGESGIRKIPIKEIVGFTTQHSHIKKPNYCMLYIENEEPIETKCTLQDLLKRVISVLPEDKKEVFIKVNDSWVVNRSKIDVFNLKNKQVNIPIFKDDKNKAVSISVSDIICNISIDRIPLKGFIKW